MLIVDSQVHIWAASTPQRPWPTAGDAGRNPHPQKVAPLSKGELLKEMDVAGVQGVVIVPPSWEGEYNDLALDAAQSHPRRFAVMGRLDITAPDAKQKIKNWRSQPGMLGLRFLLAPGTPLLDEGADCWLWGEAEKQGLPITIAPRGQYKLMGEVASRHPGLRLSIDHMGGDSSKHGAAAFPFLEDMLALGKLPNIAVKTSALPCVSDESYPHPLMQSFVRRVYDAYGPTRMFWGSDLSRLPCSYTLVRTMFTEEMPWLKGEELEQVMGKAVCKWFGWDLKV
jgi:L-fuconolactonase